MLVGNSFNRIEKSLGEDCNGSVSEEIIRQKRCQDEGELGKSVQNLKPSGHSVLIQSYSEKNIDDNGVVLTNGSNENSQAAINNVLFEDESGNAREDLHIKENNEVISVNDSVQKKTSENVVNKTKLADHEKSRENRDDFDEEYIFSPRTQGKIDLEKWSKGNEVSSISEVRRKYRSSFKSTPTSFTYAKLAIETLEQSVKYVQS